LFGGLAIAAAVLFASRNTTVVALSVGDTPVLTQLDRWMQRVTVCRWSQVSLRTDKPSEEELAEQAWEEEERRKEAAEAKRREPQPASDQSFLDELKKSVERADAREDERRRRGFSRENRPEPKYEMRTVPTCISYGVAEQLKVN